MEGDPDQALVNDIVAHLIEYGIDPTEDVVNLFYQQRLIPNEQDAALLKAEGVALIDNNVYYDASEDPLAANEAQNDDNLIDNDVPEDGQNAIVPNVVEYGEQEPTPEQQAELDNGTGDYEPDTPPLVFFSRHGVQNNSPLAEHMADNRTNTIDSRVEAEKALAALFKVTSSAGGIGNMVPKKGRNPASPRSRKRRDKEVPAGDSAFRDVEEEIGDRSDNLKKDEKLAFSQRSKPVKYKAVATFIRKCLREVVETMDFTTDQYPDFRTPDVANAVLLRMDHYLSYYKWFREKNEGIALFQRSSLWRYVGKRMEGENADPRRSAARLTAGRIAASFWVPRIKNVEVITRSYPMDPVLEAGADFPYETDVVLEKFRDAFVKFLSIAPVNPRIEGGELVYEFPKLTRGRYPKRERVNVEGVGVRMTPKGADDDGRRCDEGTKVYSELCKTEKALKRIDRARQMAAVAKGFQNKVETSVKERDKYTYGNRVKGFEYYAGYDTVQSIVKGLSLKTPKITKLPILQGDDDPMTAEMLRIQKYENEEGEIVTAGIGRHRDDINQLVQETADSIGYVKVPGSGSSVKRNACSEFLDAYRLTRTFEFSPMPPLMFVESDTGKTMEPDDAIYMLANQSGFDVSVIPHPCRVCEEQSYGYLVGTHRGTPNRLGLGPYARLVWYAHYYPDPHSEAVPIDGGKDLYEEVTSEDAAKGQAHMEMISLSKHFDAPLPVQNDYALVSLPYSVPFETDVGKAFESLENDLTGKAPSYELLDPVDRGVFEMRIGWVPSFEEMADPETAKKMTSRDIAAHRLVRAYVQLVPEATRFANFRRMYGADADPTDVSDASLNAKIGVLLGLGMFGTIQIGENRGTYKSLRLANTEALSPRDVVLHVPVDCFYPPDEPAPQVALWMVHPNLLPEYATETETSRAVPILNFLAYDYGLAPEMKSEFDQFEPDRRTYIRYPDTRLPGFNPYDTSTYPDFDPDDPDKPSDVLVTPYKPYVQEHLIYVEDRFSYVDPEDGVKYYYAPAIRAMSTGVELANNQGQKVFYRLGSPDPEFGYPRPGSMRCDIRYPMYMLETKKTFMERKAILARLRENVDFLANSAAAGHNPDDEAPEQYRWWNKGPSLGQKAWDQRGPENLTIAEPPSNKRSIMGSLAAEMVRGLGARGLRAAVMVAIEYALAVHFKVLEGPNVPGENEYAARYAAALAQKSPGDTQLAWTEVGPLAARLREEFVKSRNVGISVDPNGYWPTAARKIFPAPSNDKPLDYERAEFEAYRDAFRNLYRVFYFLAALSDETANVSMSDAARITVANRRADAVLRYLIAVRCRMHALYQLSAPLKSVKFFERFPPSLLVAPEVEGSNYRQNLARTSDQRHVAKDARSDKQNPRVDAWWRFLHPKDLPVTGPLSTTNTPTATAMGSHVWTHNVWESTTNRQLLNLMGRDYAKHRDQLLPWIDEARFPAPDTADRPYAIYEPMGPISTDAWFGCLPLDAPTVANVAAGNVDDPNNDARTLELMALGPEVMMYACFDGATHVPGDEYSKSEAIRLSKPAYFTKTNAVFPRNPLRDPLVGDTDPDPMADAGYYDDLNGAVETLGIEYF